MLTTSIEGVQGALRTLRQFEPELYKQIGRDMRQAAKPLQEEARRRVPDKPPISGFARDWQRTSGWTGQSSTVTGWNRGGKTRNKVRIKTGGKKRRDGTYLVVAVEQSSPIGAVYDMAGRKNSGSTLAKNLQSKTGLGASRGMWPAANKMLPSVRESVTAIVEDAMQKASEALK